VPVSPEAFGAELRRLRERSGLTQEQLAERSRLSPRAIRALELGERLRPYPHTLRALATALDLTADEQARLVAMLPRRVLTGRTPQRPVPTGHPIPLPARRQTFGRDAELAEVAANLVADPPLPTVILGAPGIGKTNLALAALHEPAVAARYGERCCFVRCEGAPSAAAVVIELARVLGLPLVGGDPLASCLTELMRAPAVVCLDNAETPWEADTLRCEALFQHIANVAALLVSLRGWERPGGAAWARPLRLDPLDAGSATALFLTVADERFDQPDLHGLLQEMGGVPLAVELLAHAAEGEVTLDGLVERWRGERVGLLERGAGDHRLLSVAASVEVSWNSPLMTGPARRMLSLLGRLPDGIAHSDLDVLVPDEGLRSASVLRRRALAFDEVDRLRTHPPLRHHVETAYPPDPADWMRAVAHYCGRADRMGWRVGAAGGVRASRRLSAETANLTVTILAGLEEPDASPALHALVGAARFVYFTGVDLRTLFQASLDATRAMPPGRDVAGVLKGLGDVALAQSDHTEARARYGEGLSLFRAAGDVSGVANCVQALGDIALRRSDHEAARACYEEALPLYRGVGDVLGEANCVQRLGDIAVERSEHDPASARYEEALPLYRRVGDVLGEANCIHSLGDVALRRSHLESAQAGFEEALPLYRQIGDVLGEANCIQSLGDVAMRRSDHETAKSRYDEALLLYRQVGDVLGEANCIQGLGDVALERSDHEWAATCHERALALYRRTGSVLAEANCLQGLGDIALERSDAERAMRRYGEALDRYRQVGDAAGEASCSQALADIATYPTRIAHRRLVRIASREHLCQLHVNVARNP
jgi:tetratricopeptide (TPR) repeat protein/transcriptional regulator with XRE-family HTH domain